MTFQLTSQRPRSNADRNKLSPEDRPAHDWYRFVLSFPPHLVREYARRFELTPAHVVLDPFCGTGTTLVQCKKEGIGSVGVEAHPMPCLASRVKTNWSVDPDGLLCHAQKVAEAAQKRLRRPGGGGLEAGNGMRTLPAESARLLLRDSISPVPLHKALVLLDQLRESADETYRDHELLALARALVTDVSNLHFGPEVGVRGTKEDAQVVQCWMKWVRRIAADLRLLEPRRGVPATVHQADSRDLPRVLERESVDAVITSPPYPNEKDYTRTTRLESVILGFVRDREQLRNLKQGLLRSNTRNVYKGDEDDRWVEGFHEVQRVACEIERRRIELGKTSGFERLYHRVTRLYFGGMARHLQELKPILRPGARLAYVVGDQASYLRVMIRTGQLLAEIAQALGYELVGIDLFRTRLATATRQQLREEVVVLRWPGGAA